jgi:cell division protein FtsB
LSKVATTYWDNSQSVWKKPKTTKLPRNNRVSTSKEAKSMPQWFIFAIVASITFMLCLTINLRAFSEMSQEMGQNETLIQQFEKLSSENLLLQEEIHDLKNDSRAIEREARKMGMSRPNEKILVPTN